MSLVTFIYINKFSFKHSFFPLVSQSPHSQDIISAYNVFVLTQAKTFNNISLRISAHDRTQTCISRLPNKFIFIYTQVRTYIMI